MGKNFYVTIGRQYGSGGREIGEKLAQKLGVPFYDKELLEHAAEHSDLDEKTFEQYDEKPTSAWLYYMVSDGGYGNMNLPLNHKVFLAQFEAIKKLAEKGSCVIIGRCADYALDGNEGCINVFIYADEEIRCSHAVKEYGIDKKSIKGLIKKTDKDRASYYDFYTGKKWGAKENYDISLNSGKIGIDGCVEIIKKLVEIKTDEK